MRGGARPGSGRHRVADELRKVPVGYRVPRWLRDWLTSSEREKPAAQLIEEALRKTFDLNPPK